MFDNVIEVNHVINFMAGQLRSQALQVAQSIANINICSCMFARSFLIELLS